MDDFSNGTLLEEYKEQDPSKLNEENIAYIAKETGQSVEQVKLLIKKMSPAWKDLPEDGGEEVLAASFLPNALTAANPYHDDKGRFTTGPEEETGGGVSQDLETKKGIEISSHISFVPTGGQRAVTIKVVGKDRGKGSGVSGQRVVNGVVKPGVNHYEVPTGVQVVKPATGKSATGKGSTGASSAPAKAPISKPVAVAPVAPPVKTPPVNPLNARGRPPLPGSSKALERVAATEKAFGTGSPEHQEAVRRFAGTGTGSPVPVPSTSSMLPKLNEGKSAYLARIAQEKIANAEKMYGTGSAQHQVALQRYGSAEQRIAGMKMQVEASQKAIAARAAEVAAQIARNKIEGHAGLLGPGSGSVGSPAEQLARAREAVTAEVSRRGEEMLAARNKPSDVVGTVKITDSSMSGAVSRLSEEGKAGVMAGLRALEQAGLKGDHGSVELRTWPASKSANGGYYPGFNQMAINRRLYKGDAAFTTAHEYGHHLDRFEGLGTTGGRSGVDMAKDPEFLRLVKATPEVQHLIAQRSGVSGGDYNILARGVGMPPVYRDRGRASYLTQPTEMFARATAQWATIRSGNQDMTRVLNRRRDDHWSDESFRPIAAYLDKVLAGKSKSDSVMEKGLARQPRTNQMERNLNKILSGEGY